MDKRVRQKLGYDRIIELLTAEAASDMARSRIAKFRPLTDIYEIRRLQSETSEAYSLIIKKGNMPLVPFYDIDGLVRMAAKGRALTMRQLLEVLYNLRLAGELKRFLSDGTEELPRLSSIGELLEVKRSLIARIDGCIVSEDEMSDAASPELRSIRRQIARQNEAIRSRLNNMVASAANRSYLQDAIVTMRDGRYVVPVKQEHRSRFPGIIHDQSSTGATLFVEPQAVVELNNELRQLEIAERAEIERILQELSGEVAEAKAEISNNQKLLLSLDIMNAKAKLSVKLKAAEPEMVEGRYLKLKNARHPLIDAKKVVPISLELGGSYDTLVITGPNTGGKTVTLKTLGLLCMMAQSGLHIPASEGTLLPVFESIYADIGDEQSIEQSLSTFSSHMSGIVNILKNADENSLALLDELGAGTDPGEGAALAIAVLERLAERGVRTLATTHYTELKKYALNTEGVENASMHFDLETLSPTYRLSIGVPGSSKAFEIARKLGLDEEVLKRADAFMEEGDAAFEELVASIEQDRIKAEEERAEASRLRLEAEEEKRELEKRTAALEREKEKILSRARAEAGEMLKEASELSKEVQEELRGLARLDSLGARNEGLSRSRAKLREAAGKYGESRENSAKEGEAASPDKLRIGGWVRILSLGESGEVLSLPDEKGELFVQMGQIKLKTRPEELSIIVDGTEKKKKPKERYGAYSGYRMQKAMEVRTSINVQGKNLADALADVEKYLDDAFLAGLDEVSIIHGRGEGILREGIARELKGNAHVKAFRKGRLDEGGDGVTVVALK